MIYFLPAFTIGFVAGLALALFAAASGSKPEPPKDGRDYVYFC